jgi:integrase/recombinase XerD
MLRHTMATLMLENGADVRYIQEMLGHCSLESTQIYTHVAIRKLQKIHAATHPGAMLERKKPVHTNEDHGHGENEEERRAELLAALDVETEDA